MHMMIREIIPGR